METLFTWTSAQWGLGVGLLIVANVVLYRMLVAAQRDQIAQRDKRIEELEIQSDLYRDRWLKAIDRLEVADEAATRLAAPRRRSGGS